MTDEELSLKIAEFLEPKPKQGDSYTYAIFPSPTEETIPNIYGIPIAKYQRSIGGAWRRHITVSSTVDLFEWEHRNMATDPAMTVRLMQDDDFDAVLALDDGGFHVRFIKCESRERFTSQGESLGRVVAEAFARAKGLL